MYQFTSEGEFVRMISSRGNGPADYTSVACIDIDESSRHIYVLASGKKINVYDMEIGTYRYTRKAPSFSSWAFAMLSNSASACFQYNFSGQEKSRITDAWIFMPYNYWQLKSSSVDDIHLVVYDKNK